MYITEKIDGTFYKYDELDVLTEIELEDTFEDEMDDCYSMVEIMGFNFSQIRALKELDPCAYRQAFLDWLDSECKNNNLTELANGDHIVTDNLEELESDEEL